MQTQPNDSTHERSVIEQDYYLTPREKNEARWRAERDLEYIEVPGFPDYEYATYFSGFDVRKKGTHHHLNKHWYSEINFLAGQYVIMWFDGVKCKVSVKSDIFKVKKRKDNLQ